MATSNHSLHRVEHRLLTGLCCLLALLQLLDLHSSLRAAGRGRIETNPAVVWGICHFGLTWALIAFKATALAIICAYHTIVGSFDRVLWPSIALLVVCAIYGVVVINNYS